MDYDFWIDYIGTVFYAVSVCLLIVIPSVWIFSLLTNIIVAYWKKNLNPKAILKSHVAILFQKTKLFLICYIIYVLLTGKFELPHIKNFFLSLLGG